MYRLQKISDFENCEQIQALFSDLPKKPYCTNAKGYCHIKPKEQAFTHSYIQPNHPAIVQWLVFDIDNSDALFAFFDKNAPRPQLIIKNPRNGHAHYCYKLSEKVGLWGKSSVRAIKYLKAVYHALQRKLGADLGYSGNLIKNPTHSDWLTYTTGAKKSYTLDELAEWLDLTEPTKYQAVNDEVCYFGRNHEVFERTRHQAYRIADRYSYNELYKEVFSIASNENERFRYPLDPRELHHIAKSITRFCKSPRFGAYSAEFLEKQRRQGRNGGLKSDSSKGGLARSAKYDDKRQQARALREQGLSMAKIAQELGTHKTQISRWLKSKIVHSASQSDNSHFGVVLAESELICINQNQAESELICINQNQAESQLICINQNQAESQLICINQNQAESQLICINQNQAESQLICINQNQLKLNK